MRRRLTTGTGHATSSANGPRRDGTAPAIVATMDMGKLLLSNRRVVIQPAIVEGLPLVFKPTRSKVAELVI